MHGHEVASGCYVLNAWTPGVPWLLRLECMGTKWPMVGSSYMHRHQVAPGCYVLNAWAPSGPWLVSLECMVTKCPLVRTS